MNFRIGASQLDFYVDIRLRNFDGRWLAVADIGGDHEIGLGRSARDALAASLACLGAATAAVLLGDSQLLAVGKTVR